MLPLADRRILVTRSRQQASALAHRLEALGATPVLIPTVEILPPATFDSLDDALVHLEAFDWLVFTSVNAVHAFQQRLQHLQIEIPRSPTASIGPSTAAAVAASGLNLRLIPPQAVAESLLEALLPHIQPGCRVLIVRAALARNYLPQMLQSAGAHVTIAEAYRNVIPQHASDMLTTLLSEQDRYPHAITFTSSSTALNLVALLEAAHLQLAPQIVRASIGPITSQTLLELDLPAHVEAAQATIESLCEALVIHFTSSR